MNKLIYAIGIAVAATFTTNTKIVNHQSVQKTEKIEQTVSPIEPAITDSTLLSKEIKLP